MGLFDKFKPKSVDSINPTNELYDELKEHKLATVFVLLANVITSIILAGMTHILCNGIITMVSHNVRKISLTLRNCISYGFKDWWLALIIFFLLCYVTFRMYRSLRKTYKKNYKDNYLKSKKETYGGAHFQDDEELQKNFNIYDSIEDTDDDVFATDENKKIYTLKWPPGMNKNMLFYGDPGAGKSSTIVKAQIYQGIRRGISMVVTDTKGDLYKETSSVARECGYIVRILNLKPKELRNSDGFDLFHSLDPNDDSLDVQADVITNIIFQNTSGLKEVEDYWYKNEYNLVKMAIMVLVTEKPYILQKKNKFPEIYNFLTEYNADTLEAKMNSYNEDSVIYKCYKAFSDTEKKNQGQIINGAAIRLQKLANPVLQKVLSVNEMDTVLPMKKKCIYYVVIPDQDNTYRFLSALFFSRIFIDQCDYSDNLTREEKKSQLPVKYILDEYKNTGGIVGLPEKIATVRSRKIELTIILQDANQLLALYDEADAATIKNCCVVKGMLSTNDPNTAQEFSDLLGTQTVIVENLRYFEDAADIVHAHDTIQKTLGEGERPLLYPSDFWNGKVKRDEIIYVIKGMPPVRLLKYFCEKEGKPIHPMEAWGMELGEKKTSRHKPIWRHDLEILQAQMEKAQEQNPMAGFTEQIPEPKNTESNREDITHNGVHVQTRQTTVSTFSANANSPTVNNIVPKNNENDDVDDFFGFEIT